MKRTQEERYFLTPRAEGWTVWHGNQAVQTAATLDEAAGHVPPTATFQLSLPSYPLIMERLQLPATERDELDGMLQLQWEKTLPFTPEEIVGSFVILRTEELNADIWSVAVPQEALEEFSEPCRKINHWPAHVTPHVCDVAATCPAGETVLVLYAEAGHWVLAFVEDRRPGWVHVLHGTDAAQFAAEFPSLLLTAGMGGVQSTFSKAYVSPETALCEEALRTALDVPVERLPEVAPASEVSIDLLPPAWLAESKQQRGRKVLKQRLILAGSVYLAVIIAAMVHLFLLHRESDKLEAQLSGARPDLAAMQSAQGRSNALSPAIDPHRYTIETLFLLQRSLPTEDVHFTEFEQLGQQWRVVCEAPLAGQAVDFLTHLKTNHELAVNDGEPPPRPLPNGKFQYQVTGKQ
jgi:hypothetical protein